MKENVEFIDDYCRQPSLEIEPVRTIQSFRIIQIPGQPSNFLHQFKRRCGTPLNCGSLTPRFGSSPRCLSLGESSLTRKIVALFLPAGLYKANGAMHSKKTHLQESEE